MSRTPALIATIVSVLLGGIVIAATGNLSRLCHGFVGSGEGVADPKVVTERCQLNLGTLVQQGIRRVEFVVCNKGGRRLVITRNGRGCCGQMGDSSSRVVMPGDSVTIHEEIDTSLWCGQLRQEFAYRTNDPQHPRLTFTVVAEIVAAEDRQS